VRPAGNCEYAGAKHIFDHLRKRSRLGNGGADHGKAHHLRPKLLDQLPHLGIGGRPIKAVADKLLLADVYANVMAPPQQNSGNAGYPAGQPSRSKRPPGPKFFGRGWIDEQNLHVGGLV
jgi:hypothetical protein